MTPPRAPGVLRAAAGRLARPRHAAAPALHGVASELRRARRGGRAGACTSTGCWRRWPPSSSPSGSARTRSTSCNGRPLRHAPLRPHADRAAPSVARRRGRDRRGRRRSTVSPLLVAARARGRASSSWPTTSSCSAAASTPTSGSRRPGARSPRSPATGSTRSRSASPGVLVARGLLRPERRAAPAEHAGARAAAAHRRRSTGEQQLADGTTVELSRRPARGAARRRPARAVRGNGPPGSGPGRRSRLTGRRELRRNGARLAAQLLEQPVQSHALPLRRLSSYRDRSRLSTRFAPRRDRARGRTARTQGRPGRSGRDRPRTSSARRARSGSGSAGPAHPATRSRPDGRRR